ncbi:hypothetical protein [Labrys sp. ZIDIC5]|uniref:hypothetical protein n=1 Tax=Labrys sedimenti TaxID=3106036 RepID=UPI002ACAD4AD|nr:hypothetical protein [Labrys sp. ZIDIC5]MDZ5451692.1 hypothetical protein [Labrys sp. ZIDIC5]
MASTQQCRETSSPPPENVQKAAVIGSDALIVADALHGHASSWWYEAQLEVTELSAACVFALRPAGRSSRRKDVRGFPVERFEEITMAVNQATVRMFKADTRAMRVSAAEAERQLTLALWLVGLLATATVVTATIGFFA